MNLYSPSNKKAVHINKEQLMNQRKNEIKRIASEGRHFRFKINEQDDEYYLNRIIALKAENDIAYNDSKRQEISHIDEQIYKELNFIKNQIETVKNELKLCDSVSSGRNRSNNPSIISSKTLETMHQKLSHIYTNNSVNHTSKIRNFSNYVIEKQQNLSPKSQCDQKISNSYIKWKNKAKQQGRKIENSNNVNIQQGQSNDYLFCLFSRLSNSSIIQLMGKNKIRVNQEDKCRNQCSYKTYTFKNNLITTFNEIDSFYSQNKFQKNFMIIGGKSTSKKKIVEQLIRSMILQLQSNVLSIKVSYAIHGSISKSDVFRQLPFNMQNQEVALYQQECHLQAPEVIFHQLQLLIQQSLTDPYYYIKQFFHDQLQMTQNPQIKKTLMNLINKDISCIKGYNIQLSTYNEKLQYNILTTNYLISSNNYSIFTGNSQSLLQNGQGHNFILECLEQMNNDETVRLFCINPLRYRINDSLHLLKMMIN
ncbi:unnamed protein product (macronuclear) [Paramecium tetraurelia]|uniref:Uncharacterized protein n=1 Tax=Paramecium tetraurelia TaxID=5888 RepID=A0D5W1_PARTE|nr:uncharacterized protein GSPATT00013858001 [Paramecium tetraurelia]CAK78428.1 unnamed protein product [Paramecium tetraurelia]|eukprot:XP_001445825.1 hypothetical protein (macronuclear) [Paramecium tetraurelia strain d4-2]